MRSKKGGNLFFEFISLFSLIVFTGFFAFSALKIFQEKLKLKNENLKMKNELEKEISKNQELRKNLERVKGESFWEEKARERGYKKVGENEVIIYPQK